MHLLIYCVAQAELVIAIFLDLPDFVACSAHIYFVFFLSVNGVLMYDFEHLLQINARKHAWQYTDTFQYIQY